MQQETSTKIDLLGSKASIPWMKETNLKSMQPSLEPSLE